MEGTVQNLLLHRVNLTADFFGNRIAVSTKVFESHIHGTNHGYGFVFAVDRLFNVLEPAFGGVDAGRQPRFGVQLIGIRVTAEAVDAVCCTDFHNRFDGVLEGCDDVCAIVDKLIAAGGLKTCVIPAAGEDDVDGNVFIHRLRAKGERVDSDDNVGDGNGGYKADVICFGVKTGKNAFQIPDILDRSVQNGEVVAGMVGQRNGIERNLGMTVCNVFAVLQITELCGDDHAAALRDQLLDHALHLGVLRDALF